MLLFKEGEWPGILKITKKEQEADKPSWRTEPSGKQEAGLDLLMELQKTCSKSNRVILKSD